MSTRLLIHVAGIVVVVAGTMLVTFLPFLPGRSDDLAVPLSGMAQAFGFFGLLLVPVGVLWVASGYSHRLARKRHGIAIGALIVASIVWMLVSIGGILAGGFLLTVGAMALGSFVFIRGVARLRLARLTPATSVNAVAFYMAFVPVVVFLLQLSLVPRAIAFSRDRAIRNSAQLIADIEQYRVANGRYPESLLSVNEDYLTGIIGVREYQYEPKGDSYNVIFEQFARNVGTQEFVVYNPHDEQAMTSHRSDRLRLTAQQLLLDQTRGHYAVHDAAQPHWKYYWFD